MMDSQPDPQKPPSAQIVGQEFVKQYYTMLNAAPGYLHRFYSNNSSFLHGSVDGRGDEQQQTVTGQVEIHKKIMSLNFNNCHARICQVDSQSSIGGSVVVQVIGELSNDGQPMRRFVQTFVLAPQTAKKYYVHSDIFRYQDIYFQTTNEMDGDYVEEEVAINAAQQLCYDGGHNDQAIDEIVYEDQVHEQTIDSGCNMSEAPITPAHNSSESVNDGATEDNTGKVLELASPDDAVELAVEDSEERQEEEVVVEEVKSLVEAPGILVKPLEKEAEVKEDQQSAAAPEPTKVSELLQPIVEPVAPAPPKPMTWAAMASRNAGGPPAATAAPLGGGTVTHSSQPTAHHDHKSESGAVMNAAAALATKTAVRVAPTGPDEQRGSTRPMMNGNRDENGPRRPVGGGASQQQLPQQQAHPDNQQIFVGNLPQTFIDQDLIEFFEQYGKVLEFKINRKGGVAGNNVGQKNFGFMAFDSAETVQKVLAARPIFVRNHRLNIEEKKPKEELAAARLSTPRYQGGGGGGAYFVRSGDSGPSRRGGFNRPDNRSNSSDEGRTY